MPDLTTQQGVPLWGPSEAPANGPASVKASLEALIVRALMRFASPAARDSALTANGLSTAASRKGLLTHVDSDPSAVQLHNGTGWVRIGASANIYFGQGTVVFSGGVGALTHGLGQVPTFFAVLSQSTSSASENHQIARATLLTSTTAQLFGWTRTGALLSSATAINVQWVATTATPV